MRRTHRIRCVQSTACHLAVLCLLLFGGAIHAQTLYGVKKVWHPITIDFEGPVASETDAAPNPFLDYRLQVRFVGPGGRRYDVPGFFTGDGRGGARGNVWRVRFCPDRCGTWKYAASMRRGPRIAVDFDPSSGEPITPDGVSDSFEVSAQDPEAPGFLKWGRLAYVGGHYLKFADGPYWIRGGTDSPREFPGV